MVWDKFISLIKLFKYFLQRVCCRLSSVYTQAEKGVCACNVPGRFVFWSVLKYTRCISAQMLSSNVAHLHLNLIATYWQSWGAHRNGVVFLYIFFFLEYASGQYFDYGNESTTCTTSKKFERLINCNLSREDIEVHRRAIFMINTHKYPTKRTCVCWCPFILILTNPFVTVL